MRFACLAVLLAASGASAQSSPVFDTVTLGMGPATGFQSTTAYAEIRARHRLTPLLALEPLFGIGVERGEVVTFPCLIPPCTEGRVGQRLRFAPGAALTLRAPEAALPGPLADAHVGGLMQFSVSPDASEEEVRLGMEVGAAVRVSRDIALGVDLQVSNYASLNLTRTIGSGDGPTTRTSVVPLVRLGYAPDLSRPLPLASPRVRASVASGVASGFRGGALQTELRAGIPLGGVVAFEPALAYTAATVYDEPPLCAPNAWCPTGGNRTVEAIALGAGLSAHSGRFRAAGVPLADAYLGATAYLVNPTSRDPNQTRFAIQAGAAVPLAASVALGLEVQASAYSGASFDRSQLSFAPMLRLAVGG